MQEPNGRTHADLSLPGEIPLAEWSPRSADVLRGTRKRIICLYASGRQSRIARAGAIQGNQGTQGTRHPGDRSTLDTRRLFRVCVCVCVCVLVEMLLGVGVGVGVGRQREGPLSLSPSLLL